MLNQILTADIFAVFMIFARIGTAFITLPTIGESFFPIRSRLLLAVLLSLLIAPVLAPKLPTMPPQLGDMIFIIMMEVLYGAFIGAATRILFNAIAIAGSFIANFTGLASAMVFNPTMGDQGSLITVFLSLLALVLMMATNMHHLLIQTVVESYVFFVPGDPILTGDFVSALGQITMQSFALGLQISAPFLLVTILLYTMLAIMARLMPQFQIFFVALPLQIILGYLVLLFALSGMMIWFLDKYKELLEQFLMPVTS